MPDSLTKIGDYAFNNCTSLDKFNMTENNSLEEIGLAAFSKTKIKTFIISSKMTTLGDAAFMDCGELATISGGVNIEVVGAALVLLQEFKDALLITEKHDAAILAHLLECHHCTFNRYLWGEIATHSINTDFYHTSLFKIG